jgi:hypothetical protein
VVIYGKRRQLPVAVTGWSAPRVCLQVSIVRNTVAAGLGAMGGGRRRSVAEGGSPNNSRQGRRKSVASRVRLEAFAQASPAPAPSH